MGRFEQSGGIFSKLLTVFGRRGVDKSLDLTS